MSQPVICRTCGNEFTPTDRAYRIRQAKFCSPKCWYASIRKPHNCAGCGKELPPTSQFGNKWCSRACRVQHHGFRQKIRKPKPCKRCGKEFPNSPRSGNGKYCSWACYSSDKAIEPQPCKQCGVPFKRRNHERFCSIKCAGKWNQGTRNVNYRGRRSGDRGPDWIAEAAAARKRDDYTCQGCGLQNDTEKALHVDHLIPYRLAKRIVLKKPGLSPNHPDNLLTLCVSCHMQKTWVERYVHHGDISAYFEWASLIVGKQRLRAAMELFGMWETIKHEADQHEAGFRRLPISANDQEWIALCKKNGMEGTTLRGSKPL